MFPAEDNENQQLLSHESRKSIELCTKIRKQFQQAVLEGHREQQVMNVVDLMEEMQRGWRAANGENAQLREQNGRLKRQIENFETALAEARVENQRLNSQHAADEQLIGALQLELDQYKERFSRARLEIQNAGLGIGMPSTDQPQKKVTPADEDTTEEDDDENVFLAQQPTANHGPKDGLPPHVAGGGDRARRRRSNSVGVLSDKQPLDFLSPFPANPPKLVLGPLFVPSAAAANSVASRMPTPRMSVQKSPPPQSKQMHQNHQLTPVSTRPRHRIPVRIGGTPPSRRKWGGGGGRGENDEGNDGQQYPPPSTEPRGKSFKYRLTPYSPASSIFCRQQQHRHNNNHRMASPIPINFSTGSATLQPSLSSKQQPKPMKTILTTMEYGPAPPALPPLMEPTNPTTAGGGITLGPFLNNGDGQNAGQGEQQQESTEKQYLPSIRPKLPAQWKSTLGKLY